MAERSGCCFVLALIASLLVSNPFAGHNKYYTAFAPKGSISQLAFPDGTIIYINAGSGIKYKPDDGRSKREVYLDGEAYFEVAKDKKRPFIVHTPCYDVNVTGTKFNVKAYQQDNKVMGALEEFPSVHHLGWQCTITKRLYPRPGEQITFNKKKTRS